MAQPTGCKQRRDFVSFNNRTPLARACLSRIIRMNHFKRPILLVTNGLIVLSSLAFLLIGHVVEGMEKFARGHVSASELANPDSVMWSDAIFLVNLCKAVIGFCWLFGILFAIIGLINFWLVPWRKLRPGTVSTCETCAAPTGGPAVLPRNSDPLDRPPSVS